MAEKRTIIDIDINASEAIKKMAEYEKRIEDVQEQEKALKKEIKEQGQATDEQREKLIELRLERQKYNSEMGALRRQVSNTMTAESEMYSNTLKGLRAQLSVEKERLASMQLGTEEYKRQNAVVDELNDRVKAYEYSYGVYVRNVGNYGNAINSLKGEARGLIDTLKNLQGDGEVMDETASKLNKQAEELKDKISDLQIAVAEAGGENTEQGKVMGEQLAELQGQLREVDAGLQAIGQNESVGSLTKDIRGLTMASMGLMAVVAGSSKEGEEGRKTMQKLQKAMMALIIVQRMSASATKQSAVAKIAENVVQKAGINQTLAQIKAETALNVVKGQGTIATKAVAVAQWAWNAALSANPIILLLTGIVALVAGIKALSSAMDKDKKAVEAADAAMQQYESHVKSTEQSSAKKNLESYKAIENITKGYNEQLLVMIKNGASQEEIAKKRVEMEKETEAEMSKMRKREIAEEEEKLFATQRAIAEQEKALEQLSKKYSKNADEIQEITDNLNDLKSTAVSLETSITQKETEESNKRVEQAEKEAQRRIDASNKAYDAEIKNLNNRQKVETAMLKSRQLYVFDTNKSIEENTRLQYAHQQEYALKEFALQQEQKKKQLEVQRKYGKITVNEYNAELEALRLEYEVFTKNMIEQTAQHQRDLLTSAIALAGGGDLQKQLDDIEGKYADALKTIMNNEALTREEKKFYAIRLAEEEERAKADIVKKEEDKISKLIDEELTERYKNDIRKFSDSEIEKTEQEIEQLKERIEKRKAAGLSALEDTAKLREKELNLQKLNLDKELQLEWKNKYKKYDIQRSYYEELLKDESLSVQRRAEYEQQLTEIIKAENKERVKDFEQYASQATNIASAMNELLNSLSDSRLEKVAAQYEGEKKSLEKQLNAGFLTQKQYDKKVAKLEEEQAKKELKIKREQAIREKAVNASQTIMNTATAIMKTSANLGYPAAIPFVAMLGAQGALQLATILSQPLPKARQGGLIKGATHEQGGVLVNTEDEERIISREPAKAFPELLNLISYIGKHSTIPNTGYAERIYNNSDMDYDRLSEVIGEQMRRAIADLNVSVSVEAFDTARQEQNKIKASARL